MKIYAVIVEDVDYNECYRNLTVFDSIEKAQQKFDDIVINQKASDPLVYDDDTVVEEDEREFTMYSDGFYSERHFCVWIEEHEVM